MANQSLLPKPGFKSILKLIEFLDLYGVNVAHSGTVVGLFYDAERLESQEIVAALKQRRLLDLYPTYHQVKMVAGGVE